MSNPSDTTNYIEDLITNVHTVISNYKDYLAVADIAKTEDNFIPKYPYITIELDSITEAWKEMPRRKTLSMQLSITYWYANLNDRNSRQGLRTGLSKLGNVLRENWDINDYCPQLGSDFLDQLHMAIGISTEAGELLDAYKKAFAYDKDIDIVNIVEEIGDQFWYSINLCRMLNLDPEEVLKINVNIVTKKNYNAKIQKPKS